MGMEKFMGFQTLHQAREAGRRPLPIVDIADVEFYFDISKREFRQVADPGNTLKPQTMKEEMGFDQFIFDTRTLNIFNGEPSKSDLPFVKLVVVPPIKGLDPEGLAKLQNRSAHFHGKTAERQKLLCLGVAMHSLRISTGKRRGFKA